MPHEMPRPFRTTARVRLLEGEVATLARWVPSRGLLRGLLLVAHVIAVRLWSHEHRHDGVCHHRCRSRKVMDARQMVFLRYWNHLPRAGDSGHLVSRARARVNQLR